MRLSFHIEHIRFYTNLFPLSFLLIQPWPQGRISKHNLLKWSTTNVLGNDMHGVRFSAAGIQFWICNLQRLRSFLILASLTQCLGISAITCHEKYLQLLPVEMSTLSLHCSINICIRCIWHSTIPSSSDMVGVGNWASSCGKIRGVQANGCPKI